MFYKKQSHYLPTLPARRLGASGGSTQYSVKVTNNSSSTWDVFMYQQQPGPPSPGVFSLAWFSMPMSPTTTATFSWDITYDFVWSQTGTLVPGVTFIAGQTWQADPVSANYVQLIEPQENLFTFNNENATGPQGSLSIWQDGKVAANAASVGIGMSGFGTFAVQAQPNTTAVFTPEPSYWIAFGSQMQQGCVLETVVGNSSQVTFGQNVYQMNAVLGGNNLWTISA